MRSLTAVHLALFATVWGAGCAGNGAESLESASQRASGSSAPDATGSAARNSGAVGNAPGRHAANEPWVACRGAQHELGADPLGPVVSHGYAEAPGFRAGLLDAEQEAAFGAATLRLGPRPGEIRYSNVGRVSVRTPDQQLQRFVGAALALAGRQASYVASVDTFWPGDASTATSFELAFKWRGVELLGARCWIDAATGEPATISCAAPPDAVPARTEDFTISIEQAEAAARVALQAPGALAFALKRFQLTESDFGLLAQARFLVDIQNGPDAFRVTLDGGGTVLDFQPVGREYSFRGYDVGYRQSDGPIPLETPIDAVPGAQGLDSNPQAATAGPFRCSGYGAAATATKTGVGICGNGQLPYSDSDGSALLARPRRDGDFTNAASDLDPYGAQAIFERVLVAPVTYAGIGGVTEARDFVTLPGEEPWDAAFYGAASRLQATDQEKATAPIHFAELQAFYSATKLQRWYELLGYRSCRADKDCKAPTPNCVRAASSAQWGVCGGDQAPRLEMYVLEGFGIAKTAPHSMRLGWIRSPAGTGGTGHDFDVAAEGSVFAHEHQHYIQYNVRPAHATPTDCHEDCEYGALAEGMSDFYSAAYLRDNAVGRFLHPVGLSTDYCAAPFRYFPTIYGELSNLRFACNTQYYNYWRTRTDPRAGYGKKYEVHYRGQITFNALYTLHRRLVEGGLSETLIPGYLLRAQARIIEENNDERILLDRLLEELLAQPNVQKRFAKTAQVKFAEKGVFPSTAVARDSIVCNAVDGCSDSDARDEAARTLALEGPLEAEAASDPSGASPPPLFAGFAPSGDRFEQAVYDQTRVTVEFSTDAAFTTLASSETWGLSPASIGNNSPVGFFRLAPSAATWNTAVSALRGTTRRVLYYRLRQCLADAPTTCIVSSMGGGAETPYVRVSFVGQPTSGGGSGCSAAARPTDKGLGGLALFSVGAALLRRRRRSS